MMQSINRTTFIIIVSLAQTALSTPQLSCPDISYPGVFARLTCYTTSPFSQLQYSGPDGIIAPQCVGNWSSCTNVEGYNASIINTTHTELEILSINPTHTGLWTCAAAGDDGNSSCELHVKLNENRRKREWNNLHYYFRSCCSLMIVLVVIVFYVLKIKRQKNTLHTPNQYHNDEPTATYDEIVATLCVQRGAPLSPNRNQAREDEGGYACIHKVGNEESISKHVDIPGIDHAIKKPVTADKDASISTSITTVAIVAGSVAVTIIVVLVIFLVRMKQSKRTQQPEKHSDENVYDSPYDVVGQTDETSGHENNTLYLTPVQGDKSFYDVISS